MATEKWGDPQTIQIRAYTDTLSTEKGDQIPDNQVAHREFQFRCGLIKAINVLSPGKSGMTLYLDGFTNLSLPITATKFLFDQNLEEPVADVRWGGHCTRHGPLYSGSWKYFVSLVFKDRGQMRKYLLATTIQYECGSGSWDPNDASHLAEAMLTLDIP